MSALFTNYSQIKKKGDFVTLSFAVSDKVNIFGFCLFMFHTFFDVVKNLSLMW